MIVLGFDTATLSTVVGLRLADGTMLQTRDDPSEGEHPGHATRLLAMAAQLLDEAKIDWSELERIAVGVGPGRFTGLRVGIATARGLAQALSLELVGVCSLHALALAAFGVERDGGILAVIDARRGEAFAAAYAPAAGLTAARSELVLLKEIVSAHALAPAELGEVMRDVSSQADGGLVSGWIAVGDGAVLYRDELEGIAGVRVPEDDSPLHMASAQAVCEIAASRAAEAIDAILPDYRRPPDAQVAQERAGASTGGRA